MDAQQLSIVIPKEYPLTLLACTLLCIECFMLGPLVVGPARMRTFTAEFMAQFKEEHQAAFPGTEPSKGGWPDAGEGRYAAKLPYKDWIEFANAQRVHQNFTEHLPAMLTIRCVSGLFLHLGTRLIYTIMYVKSGSDARRLGAMVGGLPLNLLAIASLVTAIIRATQ